MRRAMSPTTPTGTRITRSASTGPAMVYGPNGELLSPNFYRDVRVRLEARLSYLETRVEIRDIDSELDDEALRILEEQAKAELAALEVPPR